MILNEAYNLAVDKLNIANIDEAEFKALCIVCDIKNIRNSEFALFKNQEISEELEQLFNSKLDMLLSGEPLQYVIGKWDFYESEFFVGRGVLIPRPETEELVELAVKMLKDKQNPIVVDLCSGSGCIGISVAKKIKGSSVYCVEKSSDALVYLQKNAAGVDNVKIINADITKDVDLPLADMIISNPPYIKTSDIEALQSEVLIEPKMALDGGDDGLYFYRVINDLYCKNIKADGSLLLEIGNEQGEDIKEVLNNFESVKVIKDMYGNDRMVVASK